MIKIVKRRSSGKIIEIFETREGLSRTIRRKALTKRKVRSSGRDNLGRISVRHRGGGSKRLYRTLADLGGVNNTEAKVISIEYDPFRTARIALVELSGGRKRYIIAPEGLKAGKVIKCGDDTKGRKYERCQLKDIPIGSEIFDVEILPQSKNHMVRSAGAKALLTAREGERVLLKLPSGEQRYFDERCYGTVGQASNGEHANITIGKAGRKRRMGIRPTVRGKAMHPKAHPHGGGEGVNPIGLKYPKTPWGKIAIGKKTRSISKVNKNILKPRPRKKRK